MSIPSNAGVRAVCARLIESLEAGAAPTATAGEIACFTPQALEVDPDVGPASLASVLAALTRDDVPTLRRAVAAIDADERAWLGFKIVTDPAAALDSEDTDVVGIRGKGMGSADGRSGLFLVLDPTGDRERAEVVFSRKPSERDRFQMLDATRGPRVHGEQYAGVVFRSVPLFRRARVFLLGAGPVAAEMDRVAGLVDFQTVAVDFDPAYLTARRFPRSERVLIERFDAIPDLGVGAEDFACVLTRGHSHDPEALAWAVRSGAGYVGMLGHPLKNARVFELVEKMGIGRAALEKVRAPIGLRFGARTPTELAMAITAELIQVRSERRKAQLAAQAQQH
ncbi:MAG TPA: XdhC family protein [Myxococcales bacterium]|nr:XdhC family protein [Myxococcales bacterium]